MPHVLLFAIFVALLSGAESLASEESSLTDAEALALHERLLTIDTHIDIGTGYATPALDPGVVNRAQVHLPGMRAGGLDGGFFIVYTRQGALTEEGLNDAREMAEDKYRAIERMLQMYPDDAELALTAEDVDRIAATGRRVILIGMENASPLGNSIDDVEMWAERGVRYVSITHFGNNQFGGSSNPSAARGDPAEDPGLTDLGRELIVALNDHGIMIDISHVGKTTGLQAIELSRAPVIASHSGARAVHDNPRNLDDEQLRAIRDTGGVAQMVAFRSYVAPVDAELSAAQKALRERLGLTSGAAFGAATPDVLEEYSTDLRQLRKQHPDVALMQFADHIDHAVSVAGIDHVGVSGDFDGGGGVQGWDNAAESFNLTRELLRRGYSEADLAKLWGGNVLRVMRAAEAAAQQ